MISEATRQAHTRLTSFSVRSTADESAWAQVLQDENWWGADPEECSICGGAALHKWDGNGYCHAHYSQATQAARLSSDAMIGRYDRARRAGRLISRNRVADALPPAPKADSYIPEAA